MIPRIIHLCWLSGDPYPEPIKKCIESMYEKLPNYEIKIWTRENFDLDSVQWVREAFEAKKYAYAADYIRFWTLYNYGGIYLDSDVEVLKTFDDFLNHKSFFGFEYINIPEAAVMGAEKDVAWIKRCLDWYDGKSFFEKDGEMRRQVVPHLVKLAVEAHYNTVINDRDEVIDFGDLVIYPHSYFSPKNYFTEKIELTDDSVCIHRFAKSWAPPPKRFITTCIHRLVIFVFGKKIHDRLFRLVMPFPKTFNGDVV